MLAPKGVEVKVLLLRLTGLAMIVQPGAALWLLGVAALFVVFTDTHSKTYRVAGGLAHAVTHWNCIFYLGWSAMILSGWILPGWTFARFLASSAFVFVGGWIIGSFVMGLQKLPATAHRARRHADDRSREDRACATTLA